MQPPDELRDGSRAAGWLNKLRAWCLSTRLVEGVGYKLTQTTRGVSMVIETGKTTGKSSQIKLFSISETSEDTVYGVSAEGATAVIAKPFEIRLSTWNNKTIGNWSYRGTQEARTATYAGTPVSGGIQTGNEVQEILDTTYMERYVLACRMESGTDIAGVEWIDLNMDARRFVAKRELVEVCKIINGVEQQRRIVIEGGPMF